VKFYHCLLLINYQYPMYLKIYNFILLLFITQSWANKKYKKDENIIIIELSLNKRLLDFDLFPWVVASQFY